MIKRSTIHTRTCIALKLSLSLMLACVVACNRAAQQPAARPTPETPLERGIRQARSQLAKNIYTISRPDGGELTPDDLAYIRRNLPLDRVYTGLTDDRRHTVVSLHFELPPENLAPLQQRYTVTQVQT